MSSYAIVIADKAFELLAIAGSQFKKFRRAPMVQMTPADLPALGVFILRETREPDGDANAGEPRFIHRLHLGISGSIALSDEGEQLIALEAMMADIDDKLLTSVAFVSLIEGVLSMDRKSQYSVMGETTLAEIQIEMIVTFRSTWPPVVVDDFLSMHSTTKYPDGGDPASTEQVVAEYDIPQNTP